MTDDELDDPKNQHCECGENGMTVLLIIDKKWMCNHCIQVMIDKLRKEIKKLKEEN